jgi:alkyldihydroxyacetonephosphate synthase
MGDRRLKFFGWGYEGDQVAQDELHWFERTWARVLGTDGFSATPAPQLADIELRPPRVAAPSDREATRVRG